MPDAPPPALPRRRRGRRWPGRPRLDATDWALALPVLAAAAWLAGLEGLAMGLALAMPALVLWSSRRPARLPCVPAGSVTRATVADAAEAALAEAEETGRTTMALLMRIEGAAFGGEDWSGQGAERAMDALRDRVAATLRDGDRIFRLEGRDIAVVLHPTRRADLDVAMNVADRMQAAVAEPLAIGGRVWRAEARVGLCSEAAAPERTGEAMIAAAACALRAAAHHEAGAVRAFTPELRDAVDTGHRLTRQVAEALEAEQIVPWFQPQVDARTGALMGFEALARWDHPDLGLLAPAQFLPAVTAAGEDAALGERVLRASLAALDAWDEAGLSVAQVGVNFSVEELRDPRLAERVVWEVDRAGIAPARVAVEILETVTLDGAEETILRNVHALRAAGLRLDLDDFGTGAASIGHIARFGVHRIKIDRSFVAGVEADADVRRTVSAILSLATELGIETLAEGVETDAQAEVLAEIGCGQLQGFGIARPMPLADTIRWAHARLPAPERAGEGGEVDLARMRPAGCA